MGYDKPRHIGRLATGGHLAAPVVKDFLKEALADKPPIPFRVPPGIKLVRVNAKTGLRAAPGDANVILEAFKPGTAPPDSYSVIGTSTSNGKPLDTGVPPDAAAAGAVRTGTGGLY
jgi:penicillin-binding protein 1A